MVSGSRLYLVAEQGIFCRSYGVVEVNVESERLREGSDPTEKRSDPNPSSNPDLFAPTCAIIEHPKSSSHDGRFTWLEGSIEPLRIVAQHFDGETEIPILGRAADGKGMILPGSDPAKGDEDELSRHKRERLRHWREDDFQGGRVEPVHCFHPVVKARPQEWGEQFLEQIGTRAEHCNADVLPPQHWREPQDRVDQYSVDQGGDDEQTNKAVEGEPALVVAVEQASPEYLLEIETLLEFLRSGLC